MCRSFGVQAALLTTYTNTWNTNMAEELDADYGSLLKKFAEVNLNPNYNISLSNPQGWVGELDFNGPELKFRGNVEASAEIFLDWVAECFKGRLLEARRQERERCIKAVEQSRVVNIFWYPKDCVISANKVNEIYEFQLDRTLETLKELSDD
jgi:hypothetical protein